MPTVTPPASTAEFLNLVRGSEIHPPAAFDELLSKLTLPPDPIRAAELLVRKDILTPYQAKQLLAGRHKGFRLGAYVIQDMLGRGGMGAVYLAEHSTCTASCAESAPRTARVGHQS